MRVSDALPRGEDAAEAEIDLALQHRQDAVELGRHELQPLLEPAARPLRQRSARGLEPAKRGGLVHAVERTDLLGRQLVDEVMAQQIALPDVERGERFLERLLELE